MNSDLFFTLITSFTIVFIIFLLYRSLKAGGYNHQKNKVILDEMRKSIELQLYTLQENLTKNEERWNDVNHLLLRKEILEDDLPSSMQKVKINTFLKANGITEEETKVVPNSVFVLTPFHPKFEEDFMIIKETCSEIGFECRRGDEHFFKSDIFPEMLRWIVKSQIIIANINGKNPNVMYEMGIAQALDKAVLLISRKPEKLPIDIKSKRFLIYNDYENLKLQLKDLLVKIITDYKK